MHPSFWLDHESPKIGNNFPKSLSSLSGDWAQGRFLIIPSSGSHDIQHASQTLASLDQKRPHREDITVYNFLMRILRHRKAKCSAHECSSLDLNSNHLTWWPVLPPSHWDADSRYRPKLLFLVSVLFCPMSMRDRERQWVLYRVREGNEIRKKLGLRLDGGRPWMLIQGQSLFFRVKDIQILLSCPCPSQKTRARPPRQHGPQLVAELERRETTTSDPPNICKVKPQQLQTSSLPSASHFSQLSCMPSLIAQQQQSPQVYVSQSAAGKIFKIWI